MVCVVWFVVAIVFFVCVCVCVCDTVTCCFLAYVCVGVWV